jgi:hypothetical protein
LPLLSLSHSLQKKNSFFFGGIRYFDCHKAATPALCEIEEEMQTPAWLKKMVKFLCGLVLVVLILGWEIGWDIPAHILRQ